MGKILSTKEIKFGIGKNEKNKNTSTMRKGNMKVTRMDLVRACLFYLMDIVTKLTNS